MTHATNPLTNLPSDPLIQQRKQDHVDLMFTDVDIERNQSGFEKIKLTHRGLPECDFASINSDTSFLNHTLSSPLLISSMTGGASKNLAHINRHLAEAAQSQNIAMAVGSQRAMLVDNSAQESFNIRQYAPNIPLIANIGAVQLNYGLGLDQVKRAIDLLEADAIYLHLNPLQEAIQPEGDTNFVGLAAKIALLATQIDIPIILKEVGCGLSAHDIQTGIDAGINWFDLAGRGGTSWSRIEAHRAQNEQYDTGILFQDWGLTTPQALQNAKPFQSQANFIASGGIRNGIDMAKSVIMGGRLCGVAAPFLKPATQSTQAVEAKIASLTHAFKTAQFLLGSPNISDLFLNDSLIESI